MLSRYTASAAVALGLASICAGAVAAQQPAKAGWTAPKTAWGDPDLTGIWPSTDMVGVPFERPESFGDRNEVTEEELAARKTQAQQRATADSEEFVSTAARQGDGTGPPSHWLEWGKASRQASLIEIGRAHV